LQTKAELSLRLTLNSSQPERLELNQVEKRNPSNAGLFGSDFAGNLAL
jgi:hypothetical protein